MEGGGGGGALRVVDVGEGRKREKYVGEGGEIHVRSRLI